jgi:hypothetical protein
MSLTPIEWNVVVVGAWNRAILTPSGIATRLFGLESGVPVDVYVAIDTVMPHQVKHDGITVIASRDKLIVQPEQCSFDKLQQAMQIASRAIEKLPETPVSAAGINVKYDLKESFVALQHLVHHDLCDEQLSSCGYEIIGRALVRSLKFGDGQINFSASEETEKRSTIQFNFHRGSDKGGDLKLWLATPVADIRSHVDEILHKCLQIRSEDFENVTTCA